MSQRTTKIFELGTHNLVLNAAMGVALWILRIFYQNEFFYNYDCYNITNNEWTKFYPIL